MAAIDKTYASSWEEYMEVVKWAKENEFVCPDGTVIKPIELVYKWDEEDFNGKELPIMNTPKVADYFLIRHCPIILVQDRMREVYGEEYVESVRKL